MASNPTNRRADQAAYFDSSTVSGAGVLAASVLIPGQLGKVFVKDGIVYQFVKNSSTTAIAAGQAVMWSDFDDFTVTPVVSEAKRNYPAGAALGALATLTYAWIQVGGIGSALFKQGTSVGGTDAAAGETAIFSATDAGVDRVAAGTASTYVPFGIFTAASTGGATAAAMNIICPHNGW